MKTNLKQQLQNLQAPPQMEQRLSNALTNEKRRKRPRKVFAVVAAAIALFFISYNFNAFAYYSKQLFGYEKIMSANLKNLHAEGYGQTLKESITLDDGTVVTIEGLMSDSNQLLVYYKVEQPEPTEHLNVTLDRLTWLFKTYYSSSSYAIHSNDGTYNGIATFEPISGFSKRLTLRLLDANYKSYELPITYNANAALPTTLKQSINESYKIGRRTFKLDELVVTPNSTLLTGSVLGLVDTSSEIELLVDGIRLDQISSGTQSNGLEKSTFEVMWNTLPSDTKKIEIKLNGKISYTLNIH